MKPCIPALVFTAILVPAGWRACRTCLCWLLSPAALVVLTLSDSLWPTAVSLFKMQLYQNRINNRQKYKKGCMVIYNIDVAMNPYKVWTEHLTVGLLYCLFHWKDLRFSFCAFKILITVSVCRGSSHFTGTCYLMSHTQWEDFCGLLLYI